MSNPKKCRMSWGEAGFWWVESSATPTESRPKAIFMFFTRVMTAPNLYEKVEVGF